MNNNYENIKKTLEKFKKFKVIEDIPKYRQLEIEYLPKPQPYKYSYDNEEQEKNLQQSLEKLFPGKNIEWKPCRTILGKEIVILPKKIDCSNFNQGSIGDCYLISCVSALSQIPQLLNFIMGLSSVECENKNGNIFCVNFFIDGKWQKVYIKDSFPVFVKNDKVELVGVKPKENEVFLMILEKAWAQINGGYDRIEGGQSKNIFELFIGSTGDFIDSKGCDADKLYKAIKENEKDFGTLSPCGAKYYKKTKELKKQIDQKQISEKDYSRNELINRGLLKQNGGHAYRIIQTKEFQKNNKGETYKFIIISNPRGKGDLLESGIELNEIKKYFKPQSQYISDINNNYEKIGIIYMPIEYYLKWSKYTALCHPAYDCISYEYDIKNQLQFLYVFKIKLTEKQRIACQTCFQSH